MDPALWTLLLSALGSTALALEARPQPTPAPLESAYIEQLIDAHREAALGRRLVPVAAPAGSAPQGGCAQAKG